MDIITGNLNKKGRGDRKMFEHIATGHRLNIKKGNNKPELKKRTLATS